MVPNQWIYSKSQPSPVILIPLFCFLHRAELVVRDESSDISEELRVQPLFCWIRRTQLIHTFDRDVSMFPLAPLVVFQAPPNEGRTGVDPEHTGGITYPIWPANFLGSLGGAGGCGWGE